MCIMFCTISSGKQLRLGLRTLKLVEYQGYDCVLAAYTEWSLASVATLAQDATNLDSMK